MSTFRRLLARIGVGNASIDAIVEDGDAHPGTELRGVVALKGGEAEQQLEGLGFRLTVEAWSTDHRGQRNSDICLLAESKVAGHILLAPQQQMEIPFAIAIPPDCPFSSEQTTVSLRSALAISKAVDPNDLDEIRVLPSSAARVVMEAMALLGFGLRASQCHYNHRLCRQRDFVQLLEYEVEGGVFRGTLAEAALCFFVDGPDFIVVLESRRVARGMAAMAARRLTQQEPMSVTLTPAQLAAGQERVSAILEAALEERL